VDVTSEKVVQKGCGLSTWLKCNHVLCSEVPAGCSCQVCLPQNRQLLQLAATTEHYAARELQSDVKERTWNLHVVSHCSPPH
jgi:hypothetical protein